MIQTVARSWHQTNPLPSADWVILKELHDCQTAESIGRVITVMNRHPDAAAVQLQACAILRKLSRDADDNLVRIVQAGGIEAITQTMRLHTNSAEIQTHACGVLFKLATIADNRMRIAQAGGIDSILTAMRIHASSENTCWMACGALWHLSLNDDNKIRIAREGGVDAIKLAVSNHLSSAGVHHNAFGVLWNIDRKTATDVAILFQYPPYEELSFRSLWLPSQDPDGIISLASLCVNCIGCAAGGIAQWRFARRATTHLASSRIRPLVSVLTLLSCLPAAKVGATGAITLASTSFKLLATVAAPAAQPDPITNYPGYYAHMLMICHGFRPWPLPIRAESDAAFPPVVPAWVDSPPSSTLSTPELLKWKRRMMEEWKYTAEDVRVRTRVAQTQFVAECSTFGLALVGLGSLAFRYRNRVITQAFAYSQRRVSAGGSHWWNLLGGSAALVYGPIASTATLWISHAIGGTCSNMCRAYYTDGLVQQLDPLQSAFRRVYFSPNYQAREAAWSAPQFGLRYLTLGENMTSNSITTVAF